MQGRTQKSIQRDQDVLRQFIDLFLVILVIHLQNAIGRMALLVLLSHFDECHHFGEIVMEGGATLLIF